MYLLNEMLLSFYTSDSGWEASSAARAEESSSPSSFSACSPPSPWPRDWPEAADRAG